MHEPAAHLDDAANCTEERPHSLSVLIIGLASQAHGARCLPDQAGGVGHHTHYAHIISCSFLRHKSHTSNDNLQSRKDVPEARSEVSIIAATSRQGRRLTLRELRVFPAAMETIVCLSVRCPRTSLRTGPTYCGLTATNTISLSLTT